MAVGITEIQARGLREKTCSRVAKTVRESRQSKRKREEREGSQEQWPVGALRLVWEL